MMVQPETDHMNISGSLLLWHGGLLLLSFIVMLNRHLARPWGDRASILLNLFVPFLIFRIAQTFNWMIALVSIFFYILYLLAMFIIIKKISQRMDRSSDLLEELEKRLKK